MSSSPNDIIKLDIDENEALIFHNDINVGKITYRDTIDIYIKDEYRHQQFATNALYLFTKYLHNILNINIINAYIKDDLSKHVVEHSGYHISKIDNNYTLYIHEISKTSNDNALTINDNEDVIYLAGGCFWGMEKAFKVLNGIIDTTVGYANGHINNPNYEDIIRNNTGYKECIRIIFNKNIINIKTILEAFFILIDPTNQYGQGEDIGEQYKTGIYYRSPNQLDKILDVYNFEKNKYDSFYTELLPLEIFYEAEEYHQNYLDNNPNGYCHITKVDIDKIKLLNNN